MAFWNQLQSVIQWKDPAPNSLIWRWDGGTDELKNASKLIVGPGQAAIFVYQGRVEAIHLEQGTFEIRTANIPFFTTLSKFMQGFESEHKAEVYFVRMTEITNQKWGTKSPVKYEDPKYKFPVGMRAFGNFSFKITKPAAFFQDIAGVRQEYTIEEIRSAIVDRIITPLADLFAESGFSYAEIDKQRVELSKRLREMLASEFSQLGFELTDFRIENTDFDDDTKGRISRISDKIADAHAIKAMGDIDGNSMRNYAAVEQLNALKAAANNPSGTAGLGVGMGAGIGLGQNISQMMSQPPAGATVACGSCGAGMPAGVKFCPQCGKPAVAAGQAACVSCGKPMTAGAKFCPECGSAQKATCPSCKADIAPGAKFCSSCGNKTN